MKPNNRPYDSLNLLPLPESTFLILLTLQGGPKQGYAIMKEVEELAAGG